MNCSICKAETKPAGLFRVEDSKVNAPGSMCFACIYMQCLKSAKCVNCGSPNAIGFISFMDTDTNRLAPVAVCGECVASAEPPEMMIVSSAREVVPEISDQ